jgi:hypothetical protein
MSPIRTAPKPGRQQQVRTDPGKGRAILNDVATWLSHLPAGAYMGATYVVDRVIAPRYPRLATPLRYLVQLALTLKARKAPVTPTRSWRAPASIAQALRRG